MEHLTEDSWPVRAETEWQTTKSSRDTSAVCSLEMYDP